MSRNSRNVRNRRQSLFIALGRLELPPDQHQAEKQKIRDACCHGRVYALPPRRGRPTPKPVCRLCKGKKELSCQYCHGRKYGCYWCNYSGKKACDVCKGEGVTA